MITKQQAEDAIKAAKVAQYFEGPTSANGVTKIAKDALTIAGVPWQEIEVVSRNASPDMQYDGRGNSRVYPGPRYHTLVIRWEEHR